MKKIAIIACDNGLGHIRRCYLIGLELVLSGFAVELYAPKKKFVKFVTLFGSHPFLTNVDFSTATSVDAFVSGDLNTLEWYRRLPDMSHYYTVLSDNLPEILYLRPDAILSGHFFWHDVIERCPQHYFDITQSLINELNPKVIATDLFASSTVRACRRFNPVGLYIYGEPDLSALQGDALLITGGSTPVLRNSLYQLVKQIIRDGPGPFKLVFVDNNLLQLMGIFESDSVDSSSRLPSWLKQATYDSAMYRRVVTSICRPGVGTISDLLQHGGMPFCVYEPDNQEVFQNALLLSSKGLGIDAINPDTAYKEVQKFVCELHCNKTNGDKYRGLNFRGAFEAASILA